MDNHNSGWNPPRAQYPWKQGDELFADELNAAIAAASSGVAAGGPFLPLTGGTVTGPLNYTATGGTTPRSAQDRAADVANVLDYGADPTGVADSAPAFKAALLTGHDVFAPRGTYRINSQLTMTAQQTLRGQGHATILQIDTAFDPAVTTGVIVLTAPARTDLRQTIEDLRIRFVQASDIVTTATANSAAGLNTITVASAAGIVVGMSVIDNTHPTAITSRAKSTGPTTTVLSVAGSVVTLSTNIAAPGVASGDTILFGAVRSMFKTLTAGGTSGPGGTGVQYPWAIYTTSYSLTTLIRNVMITHAWNGVYFRGSAFTISGLDVFAYSVGLDIDQCYNFPSLTDYRFYPWGYYGAGVATADATLNTYYDGATVAANFGEVDGLGAHNFQTWAGQLNLTAAWSWGEFTNLMLDGDYSNLNITSTRGGFVQVTNCYSTKGTNTIGTSFNIAPTVASFNVMFDNLHIDGASGTYHAITQSGGRLSIANSNFWHGQGAGLTFIEQSAGVLMMDNVNLTSSANRTDTYIHAVGILQMRSCSFTDPGGVGATGVAFAADDAAHILTDIVWNGWGFTAPGPLGAYQLPAGQFFGRNFTAAKIIDTPASTLAQLVIAPTNTANSLEGKLRLFGTFPTGTDLVARFVGGLRAGFSATSWTGEYLDVYLSSTTNDVGSDANTTRVTRFSNSLITFDQPITTPAINSASIGATTSSTGRFTFVQTSFGGAYAAAGSTAADATQITTAVNYVSSAPAGSGVILPVLTSGVSVTIYNGTATPIKVYAHGAETIDSIAGGTGVTLGAAHRAIFQAFGTIWFSAQLGVASA